MCGNSSIATTSPASQLDLEGWTVWRRRRRRTAWFRWWLDCNTLDFFLGGNNLSPRLQHLRIDAVRRCPAVEQGEDIVDHDVGHLLA